MTSVTQAATIVLYLVLLIMRIKKLEARRWFVNFLFILEIILMITATVTFGIWGVVGSVIALALTAIGYSVYLAIEEERQLTHAQVFSGVPIAELRSFSKRLRKQSKYVHVLGPIGTAKLLRHLADCSRGIDEMEPMALTIAQLWTDHSLDEETDIKTLVRKFDQLLRLWNKPANHSMVLRAQLTHTAMKSPATFMDQLEGMIAFKLDVA